MAAQRAMAYLIVENGKHKGTKVPLPERDALVGRDEGSYLRLNSADVSRQHCVLKATGQGVFVRDLGSQNGTFVNDGRIGAVTKLQHGDLLQIGPIRFVVQFEEAVQETPQDDDIAAWLAEDTNSGVPSSEDTTIIRADTVKKEEPPGDSEPAQVTVKAKQQEPPQTLAEEAKEIIRKHLELKEQQHGSS